MQKIDMSDSTTLRLSYEKAKQNIQNEFKLSKTQFDSIHLQLLQNCPSYKNLDNHFKKKGKILTEEDYLNFLTKDRREGILQKWTKAELKSATSKCIKEIKGSSPMYKSICDCAIKALSENINYQRYIEMSEYQQGKALGTLHTKYCK